MPTIDTFRNIANTSGHAAIFEQGFAEYLAVIRDPATWIDSAEIIAIDGRKNALYNDLFG